MKQIAVFTGSRAEYGLLQQSIERIKQHANLELQLLVGGSHLCPQHGMTVHEIEANGHAITALFPAPHWGENMAFDFANTVQQAAEYFRQNTPDCLLVLGDRYETFAVACAASMANIPIAHIHGGDTTQGGVIDDNIRHALTKLAHLHFTATERSAQNVIQMGEENWRVHVVGVPGIENLKSLKTMHREELARKELAKDLGLNPEKKWILLTQHPASKDCEENIAEIKSTLAALQKFCQRKNDVEIIATGCNTDANGQRLLQEIKCGLDEIPDSHFHRSLGTLRYLNLLREVWLVLGNSSSGLLETAYFATPTVNIGQRQAGRERGQNVLDIPQNAEIIYDTLQNLYQNKSFYLELCVTQHPFGEGTCSQQIVDVLAQTDYTAAEFLNKQFMIRDISIVKTIAEKAGTARTC